MRSVKTRHGMYKSRAYSTYGIPLYSKEKGGAKKLSQTQVERIRLMFELEKSNQKIAQLFNVSRTAILHLRSGISYKT